MKRMNHPLMTIFLGLALSTFFWAGCTFLIDTESLLTECVSETDCAEGFYCDEGACLPGEAPPPFITEEPNLPDFNSDGGPPGGPPPQPNSDAGITAPPMPNTGDAGTPPTISADAGTTPTGNDSTSDAGSNNATEAPDAGQSGEQEPPVASSDAGTTSDDTSSNVDAGEADTINPNEDAGASLEDTSTNDAGSGTTEANDLPDGGAN